MKTRPARKKSHWQSATLLAAALFFISFTTPAQAGSLQVSMDVAPGLTIRSSHHGLPLLPPLLLPHQVVIQTHSQPPARSWHRGHGYHGHHGASFQHHKPHRRHHAKWQHRKHQRRHFIRHHHHHGQRHDRGCWR